MHADFAPAITIGKTEPKETAPLVSPVCDNPDPVKPTPKAKTAAKTAKAKAGPPGAASASSKQAMLNKFFAAH